MTTYYKNDPRFYNPAETLSYNYKVNMVTSMRGPGKTLGILVMLINRFLKHGEQFIYLRRTDVELKDCKDKLFDDVRSKDVFPGHAFRVTGNTIYCDDKIMGGVQALSKAYQVKSVAWPDVYWIFYDEFIIEDTRIARYLPNEPTKLEGYIETVGRLRPIRVLMAGNMATRSNPYFDHYRLWPRANTKVLRNKERGVLLHMWDSPEFREMKLQTDMGKLVAGTPYGEYMLGNTPFMDNDTFIEKPKGFLDYVLTYKFEGLEIGQWYAADEGLLYMSQTIEPSNKHILCFDTQSHGPNMLFVKDARQHPNVKELRWAYENGLVRFENMTVKNAVYNMLNLV